MATFDVSFQNLLGWEGGFGNNIHDPGGPTNLGIIQTEYDAYRHAKGLSTQSVTHIALAEAEDIYRNQYWTPTRCDELNPGVANCLFDGDVNSGDRRGVQWLQEAINQLFGQTAISVDGQSGPATVAAANALPPDKLIDSMLSLRFAFMKIARNPKTGELLFTTFGKGWTSRINGVRVQSHKLAGVEMSPATIAPQVAIKEITMTTAVIPPAVPTVTVPVNVSNTVTSPWITNILGFVSMAGAFLATNHIDPVSLVGTLTGGNFWAGIAVAAGGQIVNHLLNQNNNTATVAALQAQQAAPSAPLTVAAAS